ncbi:serine hydrolase [Actinobacteria bacterium YIM 96077]|uniref:Serine hydrolase n=1 Tax=Phytoactinopolyspora halophila TaxID=1981511 RepID=A0A329QFI7_9ACTN|nr:serine hydrolase [Phytoactinopolyspora halophila]AYY13651.1 serine hydrolase [Actinobacteria bacterium YIM 96077]RAW11215.1 serine hydrolase [Phytoactinopolyspora halophila]
MTGTTADRIQRCFDDAGILGSVHAIALHDHGEIGVLSDEPAVLASVYKLPLAVAYARMVDAGRLDPRATVMLDPETRTHGATGFAAMTDPVTVTWRDAVRSMMAVSDNAAADALLDVVGITRLADVLDDLGLASTRITGGIRDLYASLVDDCGSTSLADAITHVRDLDSLADLATFDPANPHNSIGTCRDMTRLLSSLWTDRAASPEQCEFLRTIMAQQVWTQRISAGFPFDDVIVAGKTGTFVGLRHEAGVVEYPNGEAYAVAVFTTSTRARLILPAAETAIAQAAKLAVAHLR